MENVNLQLISIAILGLGLGSISIDRINRLVGHPLTLVITYAAYVLAISIWNIPFPLQVIGVCLSVLMIYVVGVRGPANSLQRLTVELGKYSLFAYIVHLIILQILRRGFRRFDLSPVALLIPLAIAIVLTILVVTLVSAVRRWSSTADRFTASFSPEVLSLQMGRQAALLLCLAFIGLLLVGDLRRRRGISISAWLAVVWLGICASRPVSSWFEVGMAQATPDAYLEGSPLDGMVFLVLILCACGVLWWRRVSLGEILSSNRWIFVFYLFCGVSVLWSDYPFVAFKRWYKDFGNVLLLLILLTERDPVDAVKAVFVRCAYVLVPLSFIFVRYFPETGRAYTGWNGNDLMYVGVATHKNTLGALLLVSTLFLVSDLIDRRGKRSVIASVLGRVDSFVVLLMAVWLLVIANSATSLVCTILAVVILLGTSVGFVRRRLRFVEVFVVVLVAAWFLLDSLFGITASAVEGLGRDMTFTGRSEAWEIVLSSPINPLIGAGFKSFWAGERMATLWLTLPHIVQAHNGYVETYLNGGVLGLCLLLVMMGAGFAKIKRSLVAGDRFARVRFAFWVIALIYNFSEAAFNNLFFVWFTTLLVVAEPPMRIRAAASLTKQVGVAISPQFVVPRGAPAVVSRSAAKAGFLRPALVNRDRKQ